MDDAVWAAVLHKYIVPFKDINCFSPPTFIGHKDTEPLFDRKFLSRLSDVAVAAPDMKIDVYSNGVLLPKWKDRGQDFFEFVGKLPNELRFMMSYHPNNHDWSLNDYTQVVEYLKGVLRNPPSNVEFITVSHKSPWVTEEVQEQWRKTWEGYPITVHKNCSINPWTGRMEDIATCAYHGCPYSDFGHLFIGATGNIIACCLDLEEEIILGNVLKDDPADMFAKTEAFYAEQRRILEAKEIHPRGVCSNCFGQKRQDLIQLGGVA